MDDKTQTPALAIPRAVYNRMVDRFPAFMTVAWLAYVRRWGLGGVTVRNPDRALRAVVAECQQ